MDMLPPSAPLSIPASALPPLLEPPPLDEPLLELLDPELLPELDPLLELELPPEELLSVFPEELEVEPLLELELPPGATSVLPLLQAIASEMVAARPKMTLEDCFMLGGYYVSSASPATRRERF
jgi:hypothetical protein